MTDQVEAMSEELERRREECIQLRTVLATMSKEHTEPYARDYSEDGELALAYKSQKDLNKYDLLESPTLLFFYFTHFITTMHRILIRYKIQ